MTSMWTDTSTLMDLYNDKSKWYRMEEREKIATPLPKFPEGSFIEVERIIIRAGYLNSPMDMPLELLREKIYNRVSILTAGLLPKGLDDIEKKTRDVYGHAPLGNHLEFPNMLEYITVALWTIGLPEKVCHDLAYEIRAEWLASQNKDNLKTFWYVDFKWHGQVSGPKIKCVGRRDPGGYSWDGDWEPPYFAEQVRQKLYVGDYYNRTHDKYEPFYIHPLDFDQNSWMGRSK